jgi:hypothetical protein
MTKYYLFIYLYGHMTSQKKQHKNYIKPSNLKLPYIILLLHFKINSNLKFMILNFTIGNEIFWNIFNLNFQSKFAMKKKQQQNKLHVSIKKNFKE